MNDSSNSNDASEGMLLQDPKGDGERAEHHPHDQDHEIAHALEHRRENTRWFLLCFLPVILITVFAFETDFGAWNPWVTWVLAAVRSLCIAFFLQHLFKEFSFVFRTLIFTVFFLAGMIFLSLWDSEVRGIGNPIKDVQHPETEKV